MCGLQWTNGSSWDGSQGAGQQMAAMEAVLSNMVNFESLRAPVTVETGGTSVGDPSAGTRPKTPTIETQTPPTTADRAGAAILTITVIPLMMSIFVWMCFRELDSINN